MMERRGIALDVVEEKLLRTVFDLTSEHRA
jgi:hypothetical protein